MKNKRSKGFVLETMETLNKSYKGNEKEKKQAMMFLNNATEVGNKVFCFIPVELLKIDHENYQRPLQKTFKYLLDNWDDDKCDPITVNYRGDGYFYVINGQHRTEAAKAMGVEQLCCDVFVGLTLPEEAELFVGQYDGSKNLIRLTVTEPMFLEEKLLIRLSKKFVTSMEFLLQIVKHLRR